MMNPWRWSAGLAGALLVAGIAWAQAGHGSGSAHETLPPSAAAAQGRTPTDSVYQLESNWVDQNGARVPLGSLRGKPQVVAMFYANCVYVCPLIVEEMKKVERELPEEVRKQVGFALFSFDPERDTDSVLKAYAAKRDLGAPRWQLFTGNPDGVLELAAVLGFRFRKEPNGDFSHSIIITVLDRNGVIRYQMLGLNQDRAPLLRALQAAAQG
jgi:protein SCO1/2